MVWALRAEWVVMTDSLHKLIVSSIPHLQLLCTSAHTVFDKRRMDIGSQDREETDNCFCRFLQCTSFNHQIHSSWFEKLQHIVEPVSSLMKRINEELTGVIPSPEEIKVAVSSVGSTNHSSQTSMGMDSKESRNLTFLTPLKPP